MRIYVKSMQKCDLVIKKAWKNKISVKKKGGDDSDDRQY